jgi:predicted cupin superfamily sugar epimerase
VPLPFEGGHYRETYRSAETLEPGALPARFRSARSLATGIFYLLTPDSRSALHRLPGDELFHFYLGDPVEMFLLPPDGASRRVVLGHDLRDGQHLQVVVPHGVWQGSRLVPGGRWALLGTTTAPGFEFDDLEMGDPESLMRQFPAQADAIRLLTPDL